MEIQRLLVYYPLILERDYMNSIGFPISEKKNERRRAILPHDISKVLNKGAIYIEKGYGENLGFCDLDYINYGAQVVDRDTVLKQNIICDPKVGDASYLNSLENQILFGWMHAIQNIDIVDICINRNLTVIAWEEMFDFGRHIFYKNNELAGEAAIIHAFINHGLSINNAKVAVIGRGNIARGAIRILYSLGADVTVYDKKSETLLRDELHNYDAIVNAVQWDILRSDHIIYKNDLKNMKRHSIIIDISCDRSGAIEPSVPTSIENPIYDIGDVSIYAVDHTPSLLYKTASIAISQVVSIYLNKLIEDSHDPVLEAAKIIVNGTIKDARISAFQRR